MAPAQPTRIDPDWVQQAAQAHVCCRIPGMDQVRVRENLRYKLADGEALLFDIYNPVEPGPKPLSVLIHGGPIPSNLLTTPKDWGIFRSLGRLLAASGISAVTFNHRFFAPEQAPNALSDIKDLLAHVTSDSANLDIDPGRLCLWVFSGGGIFFGPLLREASDSIRCLIAYYAVLHTPFPAFSAATQIAETTGRIPPILIARAGLDMPQVNDGIDHFVQQALKK